jgi:hypothetical protein
MLIFYQLGAFTGLTSVADFFFYHGINHPSSLRFNRSLNVLLAVAITLMGIFYTHFIPFNTPFLVIAFSIFKV